MGIRVINVIIIVIQKPHIRFYKRERLKNSSVKLKP